jgi:hypothetical protein
MSIENSHAPFGWDEKWDDLDIVPTTRVERT